MKKLLALLMIWLLLPIAGAEETYTMQEGSLILMDGAGRKCQPIAMKPDFPEALLADAKEEFPAFFARRRGGAGDGSPVRRASRG